MQTIPTMEDLYSLGKKAGEVVRDLYFGSGDMELEFKADSTPVTVADKAIFKLIGEWRDALFPSLAIISEEGHKGERTGDPDQYWMLVDEVDGTWAYHLGIPVFSSLFALMKGGEVVASCIVDPISHRVYTAAKAQGAYLNKKRVQVHQQWPQTPSVGIVAWPKRGKNDMLIPDMLGEPTEHNTYGHSVADILHKRGWVVMKMGTIGYIDALVASGQLSGTIFPGATLHDTAAGHLLVEEAGGIATNLRGSRLSYGGDEVFGHIFAADERMHDWLRNAIACVSPTDY